MGGRRRFGGLRCGIVGGGCRCRIKRGLGGRGSGLFRFSGLVLVVVGAAVV